MLLFLFLGTLIIFFGHSYWVIYPIGSKLRRSPTFALKSFQLTDIFILMFVIQLPFAASALGGNLSSFSGPDSIGITAAIIFALVAVCIWLAAVLALAELGIKNPAKRIVTQLFIFPWAVVGGLINLGLFSYLLSENSILTVSGFILTLTLSVAAYQLAARWVVATETPAKDAVEPTSPAD